jgi:hypothetical protein
MSADNIIPLKPRPPDLLASTHAGPFGTTAPSTAVATVASTAVAITIPSTIHIDALVPLDQLLPDPMQLIRENWPRRQMRKAIVALLALHPNGPPIGRCTQELVNAVVAYCRDPERDWVPPSERTIREAVKVVWPWLFVR